MQPTDELISWHEGKGLWSRIPDSEWNDWKWQMRKPKNQTKRFGQCSYFDSQRNLGFSAAGQAFRWITPHFLNLLDPNDPLCPIRRQVIPSIQESMVSNEKDP